MKDNLFPQKPVLLVDDEEHALVSLDLTLKTSGINNVMKCKDAAKVTGLLEKQEFELILLDLTMPAITGQELLPQIKKDYPETPVIIVTGINEVDTAVECMKNGAFTYIVKPVEAAKLLAEVKAVLELKEMERENAGLKEHFLKDELEDPGDFSGIISADAKMWNIFKYIEAVSKTSQPVLITGETGTGKELIARAIHASSKRKGKFTAVNVAGLDDNMFSDTLFGHKKGAFTGAETAREGLIEQAKGGTLFLDEIGDMQMSSQVKLLRLIQEKEYMPLGSDVNISTDCRIVVATNRDIKDLSGSAGFRKDLFYRLKTHTIKLPALRERRADIGVLFDFFMEQAAKDMKKKKPAVPAELVKLLKAYSFPGNVRELQGMIVDAVSSHSAKIMSMDSFKAAIGGNVPAPAENAETIKFGKDLPTLKQAEEALINEALGRADNNQSIAAGMLGITRQALNSRLKHNG